MGDIISRCTADVETLDTVFSSNVAMLLANLVGRAAGRATVLRHGHGEPHSQRPLHTGRGGVRGLSHRRRGRLQSGWLPLKHTAKENSVSWINIPNHLDF
jgi:hypothetical protein